MDAPKRVWKKEYTYICIFYIKYMLYVTYMLYICIYVLNKYIHIYKYKQSYTHTYIYTYILYIYIKARHLFIQSYTSVSSKPSKNQRFGRSRRITFE